MAYDLTGKIKLIQDPQTFPSGFSKREIVLIVEDGKFPQEITFEFLQDKVSLLDGISEGQEIKVFFDLRGRYNEKYDRYFNSVVGWKIETISEADAPPASGGTDRPALPPEPEANSKSDPGYPADWDDEDPPF